MSSRYTLSDELEVLKSIYDKDLKIDGSNIIISLPPIQGKEKIEDHARVDLHLTCPEPYPRKEPTFFLSNVRGLTSSNIEILYKKLRELTRLKAGECMIYDLALCVQDFLYDNNKPGKKSCYEEMVLRKNQQKQEEFKSQVHKKTNLEKNIKEKQELLESTDNESSESGEEDNEESKSLVSNMRSEKHRSNSVIQVEEITCEHKNREYIQFNNKVLRGCCAEHDTHSIMYPGIDTTTGDLLLLQEWHLKLANKNPELMAAVEKELESIQNVLNNLKKLCHENLVSYIDFKWCFDNGEWSVYVLQEYVTGVNLNVFVEQNVELNVDFIRHVSHGILKAVQYLHSHEVVHGYLNGYNVYFDKLGIIKLVNYGIKKRMDKLDLSCKYGNMKFLDEKISQKSDILEVGQLLLKLSSGANENIIIPESQFPELREFIDKCLIECEEVRWTANKLLNHKFLKLKENSANVLRKRSGGDLEIRKEEIEKPFDFFLDEHQILNSRLAREFKILDQLGHGSFGKVLKVKNNLDRSVYAIKVIRLNMKNKQLLKKMIREVKLLSKLNHENVVRYYTSWIEAESGFEQNAFSEGIDDVDGKSSHKVKKSNLLHESDDENDEDDEDDEDDDDDVDDENDDDDVDDENDEEEEEVDGNSESAKAERKTEDSSYIVFMKSSGENSKDKKKETQGELSRKPDKYFQTNRSMYIQMEFCEKSTLRIAINDDSCGRLCEDKNRLWRLFREIVEGLAYVHEQGMIHRDLKPENIFLDSCDHVKIGDFGLATISAVSRYCLPSYGAGDNEVSSQNTYDDFHTGKVGTSLYVAPEVDKTFEKTYYNKKVDIYSLGVIFFEMCNGPFSTSMERIDVISNLRKHEVVLPDIWKEKLPNQRKLVKMLLNHDPKSRPSCSEILEEDYLPPAECEYEDFQDVMRQTLSNPKSKAYKYLVSSCFEQEVLVEDDITYQLENIRTEKQHFILDLIKDRMENILKKHGAIYLSAPLLLPQTKDSKNMESMVKLMTHSGSIVYLPYDLRVSFARYVAYKGFTRLRRYVVERVYREKKVHGLHPKEQYECAFDLITPIAGIENAKLEVLTIIQEIVNEFKSLKNRNCIIRVNHHLLLKAILIHFNSEKWYKDIFKILAEARESKYFKNKLETNLQKLGIPNANILINLFTKEYSYLNIKKELNSLIFKRGKAMDVLNKAFDQLQNVISKAERCGIKVNVKIAMGVVCNSENCSDIMFDVVYHAKQKKKKEETVIVMSGCRYDGLISKYRQLFDLTATSPEGEVVSGVGLTIHLDKVAAVLKEDNILSEYVVISSIGNNVLSRGKESMAKKLWESGIKCHIEETIETLEELTDYCRENNIIHIINLKDDEGPVMVMTWDNDKNRYQEKKMNVRDVPDHVLKYTTSCEGHSSPVFSRQVSESQSRGSGSELLNGNQIGNIHVVIDDKVVPTQRKKYENQLKRGTSGLVDIFSFRARIEIVGVLLDEQKIKDIAINFKFNEDFTDSIADSSSTKKYVLKICQKLNNLLSESSNTVIILYSLPQDKYQFIIDC